MAEKIPQHFLDYMAAERDKAQKSLAGQLGPLAYANNSIENVLLAAAMGLGEDRGSAAKEYASKSEAMYSLKAGLDVGLQTNLAQVVGGQALGHISLDTEVYRSTIRPNMFTIYYALKKTAAKQIVDYWPVVQDTGGPLAGGAWASFSGTYSNTPNYDSGDYRLNSMTLGLAYNARALTTALTVQNSFVNINDQETANAALTILKTVDWTIYWGNRNLYANVPNGIFPQIPAANLFDFRDFNNSTNASGNTPISQVLFNQILDACGQISGASSYGQPSHAFMGPNAFAKASQFAMQVVNNVVNLGPGAANRGSIFVNVDERGLNTGFGLVKFVGDVNIVSRNVPAQAQLKPDGTSYATASNPTKPATVVAAPGTPASGRSFEAAFNNAKFLYGVAICDASTNESQLTFATSGTTTNFVTTVTTGQAVTLTITPGVADGTVARIYRSGAKTPTGYTPGTTESSFASANRLSFIGEVALNGLTPVTFVDANQWIPGSEPVFLLDLNDFDNALDYRYLMPLSRINLYTNQLFTPWAVAHIGAPRVTIPKFHGCILNFVPDYGQNGFNPYGF